MFLEPFEIIDISLPVSSKTAVYPGDTPFRSRLTVDFNKDKVINLTNFTMSPHVGTHADSPSHVTDTMSDTMASAGSMPLEPFIGPCLVLDLSLSIGPDSQSIKQAHIESELKRFSKSKYDPFKKRLLFRTNPHLKASVFPHNPAFFSPEAVIFMGQKKVVLAGLDTPSVDEINSKALEAHHKLLDSKIFWLENLCLNHIDSGAYFLIAAPLKFMELEASPLRALLLKSKGK